jgi:hypothetical protein
MTDRPFIVDTVRDCLRAEGLEIRTCCIPW